MPTVTVARLRLPGQTNGFDIKPLTTQQEHSRIRRPKPGAYQEAKVTDGCPGYGCDEKSCWVKMPDRSVLQQQGTVRRSGLAPYIRTNDSLVTAAASSW